MSLVFGENPKGRQNQVIFEVAVMRRSNCMIGNYQISEYYQKSQILFKINFVSFIIVPSLIIHFPKTAPKKWLFHFDKKAPCCKIFLGEDFV